MQQYRKNLGKVSLTAEGAWNLNNSYDILSIVYDEHTQHGFISRKAVPQGVDLYNKEYWMPLNVSGYADNNVIILSKKTSEASIQSYTLEEAIASIKSVGRRPGAILGFYNENPDRLDVGGRWELWQFNDTNVYNWDNVDSWQNLYYNYNKFMGWFKDENFLNKYVPFPEIGCYAFVGSEFNEATVYRCDNKYVWNNTTQHAWDYVKVIVDGNVTVGENGNWFNNGEDTGIPASVKGENGKTPIFREKDNIIQYSFDNVNWITISDKVAAWFRWNATTGDTQANNVGRIQISRDNVTWTNLSGDIINNLHISRYIGADEALPTSGIAEGTIYAKGPTYADGDTSHANPIYRLWVYAWKGNTLAWQDNGEFQSIAAGIAQEVGDSETTVMSQKAVSKKFSKLEQEVGIDSKEYTIRKELSIEYIFNPTKEIGLLIQSDASTGVFLYIRKEGETSYNILNNYKVYETNVEHIIKFDDAISGIKVFFAAATTSDGTAIISLYLGLKLDVENIKERIDNIEPRIDEIETTYTPKAVSNSKTINEIIQEIYLLGTDASKEYEIRSMLVYSNRKTFVIAEVGGENVAQMDSPLSDIGVVNIFALNNSGISGYAVCVFPNVLNIQPYIALNKWVYTSLVQNPSIAIYLQEIKNVISVQEIINYGICGSSKSEFNDDFRMITNLIESETDGILTKIKMLSNFTGTAYFATGFVDQNGKAILNDVFSLSVVDGNNNIDVTYLGIRINKGDTLFGLPYYAGGEKSVYTFESRETDTNNDARLYFATSVGGKLFSYQSIGGAEFSFANLAWEIKEIKSPFAEKNEVKEIANNVTNISSLASKALSNSFKVKDRQGNTYKMVVVDGSISLIPQQFKNVAVLGNSITLHGRNDAVNWLTSGYGMAASTPETDFSAFILEACKSKDSSSVLTRKNLAHWETSLVLSDSIKSEVRESVSGKDLIIIKIGENVSSAATNFSSAFAEFIDYIISVNSNAEIVVCSLFWSNAEKDKVMRDVAMSKNLVYCTGAMTDTEQMEAIGHYLKSSDGSYFEVTNYGVQKHPSDIGMLMIANSILTALDMEPLDKLHSINVISNGADVDCYTKGVTGGIVTISANVTPTIKTATGLSISATSAADGKWVFTMPNEDVNISFD